MDGHLTKKAKRIFSLKPVALLLALILMLSCSSFIMSSNEPAAEEDEILLSIPTLIDNTVLVTSSYSKSNYCKQANRIEEITKEFKEVVPFEDFLIDKKKIEELGSESERIAREIARIEAEAVMDDIPGDTSSKKSTEKTSTKKEDTEKAAAEAEAARKEAEVKAAAKAAAEAEAARIEAEAKAKAEAAKKEAEKKETEKKEQENTQQPEAPAEQPNQGNTISAATVLSSAISKFAPPAWLTFDENKVPTSYKKLVTGSSTAYTGGGITATGRPAKVGHVAVNPKEIPYGSVLYVVSADGRYNYGICIAADTGGFAGGKTKIDLYFNTYNECINYGRRDVKIYVLE